MSRHLVDPELSVGLDAHLPATLSAETLAQYRSMLFDMVAAIPKPTSDAIRAVRLAIAGESAGGGLAAALCPLSRDRGGVQPSFQYLAEPMLDHRGVESDHPHTGHFGWTRDHNRFGWSMIGDAAGTVSPYASPALADDLAGLPPTFIDIGAIDLFLEESIDYARRLTRAGVPVELHVWPGAYHAFGAIDAHVSREPRRVVRTALKRVLHGR